MSALRILRPHEISLEASRKRLENTVGLILRTERSLWLFVKARKASSLDFRPSENVSLHFFAVADSMTDGREVDAAVENFVARIKSMLSTREVNMKFLSDFLCQFMSEKIFGKNSERPIPVEMAVIEISRKREAATIGLTVIDHSGNATYPDEDFTQIIFGCTNQERVAKIELAIETGLKPDFSNDEIEALVMENIADIPGDMVVWRIDFEKPTSFGL